MNERAIPILTKAQTKKIPASSFMRLWSLGSSQARIAALYFAYAIHRHFVDADKKELLQNEFYLKSALQLVGTMGYLRGAIMKFGQLLANLPQAVPRQMVEVLESLQFEAPPMHYALIREVFIDELGREPEELFASFDRQAFAAASLGQVHRATLKSGEEVAVKIQYPNIGATIDADMRNLALLLQTMRFKKDYHFMRHHIEDARTVFTKEIDYRAEAAFMAKNREIFAASQVVVPHHYPELSSRRILTMEHLAGQHPHAFLAAGPSQAKRNHFGELISYSLVHSFFRLRTVYADLHPGNYILMDDGRLGFIDFGCYRQFDEHYWRLQVESEKLMFAEDHDRLLPFLAKLSLHSSPDELGAERLDLMQRQIKWMVRPITARAPFDFAEKTYVDQGVDILKETLRKGYSRTDSFYNWTNRALLGHRALMYRLACHFDYSKLYLSEMAKYS